MAHRPRWTLSQVTELFEKPLLDLLFEAQQVHRQHFDPRQVQVSTLLSIKTGACPEDCKYCPQSSRYKTGLEAERLMEVEQVLESARKAKAAGSTRFCMGAAWKNPHERDMPYLEQMVQGVKAMGLEACMTLGTLSESQAQALRASLAVIRSDEGDARREKLAALITRFRAGVQDLPFTLADSCSAIQPLIVGDNSRALQLAEKLRQQGCWVTAIRPPTVPAGTARLRLTLTAAHEMQDIDRLLEVLHGNG